MILNHQRPYRKTVDAAYAVHKAVGTGLLEKVYEACFCFNVALIKDGIKRIIV